MPPPLAPKRPLGCMSWMQFQLYAGMPGLLLLLTESPRDPYDWELNFRRRRLGKGSERGTNEGK